MNRFRTRLRVRRTGAVGVSAVALAAAAALAGCGTGQIAQTTDQASAVNGTAGDIGPLALRDVRIEAVQEGAFIVPGSTVDLVFVAANQSTDTDDELTEITTDLGRVSLAGAKQLAAGGVLVVGAPAGQDQVSPEAMKELHRIEKTENATASVTLDKPISNGLTYGFTFHFAKAGTIGLAVPVSAGDGAPAPTTSSQSGQPAQR